MAAYDGERRPNADAGDKLVRVIHALSEGLVLQALLTPDLIPRSVYYAAFEALATVQKPAGK
jgi:hypothetical protein